MIFFFWKIHKIYLSINFKQLFSHDNIQIIDQEKDKILKSEMSYFKP